MSKNNYFSHYESPNIVIVPTVSQFNSLRSKKAKLEDTPHIKLSVTDSTETSNPVKQAEQYKEIKNLNTNLLKDTMSSSVKTINPPCDINIKQSDDSNNTIIMDIEENISNETKSGKKSVSVYKRSIKEAEKTKNPQVEVAECVNKETMIFSRKITDPELNIKFADKSNDCSSLPILVKSNEILLSSGNITDQVPGDLTKGTDKCINQNNVKMENLPSKRKNNTSWASNYMQSIGQLQKKHARITLNRLKDRKSQKIKDDPVNEDGKPMQQTLHSQASTDKNKQRAEKSTNIPQKTRKCKKIKLEITVVFQEQLSSSDTDSNPSQEDESSANADTSFLEDINIDEIVKSLCETISTKKDSSCKENENFEENNNNGDSKVNKEYSGKKQPIPSQKDKIEPKSPIPNNNLEYTLQSDLQNVNVKAEDLSQTQNLETKTDIAKENHQITSSIIDDGAKLTPVTSCPVAKPKDVENDLIKTVLSVIAEDTEKNTINQTVNPITNDNSTTANIELKSVEKLNQQAASSSNMLQNAEDIPPTPILPISPQDSEEKALTPSIMVTNEETKEKPLTKNLVTESNDGEQNSDAQRLSITSGNVCNKSSSPKPAKNFNIDQNLSSVNETKLENGTEKPHTQSQASPCEIVLEITKEKPCEPAIKEKQSPLLELKPENRKDKPVITSQPQTKILSVNSDKAKANPQTPYLQQVDKIFAGKLETRLFEYINEKFTVISNIHRGMYARVYLCKDSKNKKYAIKALNNECDRFVLGIDKERMLMELQRDVPKENLHFVYLHNGFSLSGYWCFLMDFYPKNLREALENYGKPFHIDKVRDLARQLVTAVTILRNNNIVHSDIRPGHILLNHSNDVIKLCGFDGSYDISCVNILPNIGTVNYRAPEIILGYSAGFSIDVWALALVMYEMATCTKLFPGSFNNDILYKQICTLGHIPYHMMQKSIFQDNHFIRGKFARRVGPNGKKTIIVNNFYQNNKLQTGIYRAYERHWRSKSCKAQYNADLEKLSQFHKLLVEMLMLSPSSRLSIEFVYANPFIYEFS